MKNLRKLIICSRGHKFYKSSNCPVCPKCWPGYRKKLQSDFPKNLGGPALTALKNNKIKKLSDLNKYDEKQISGFHGIGPKALSIIKVAMKSKKIFLRKSFEIK